MSQDRVIRPATPLDLQQILEIEQASFSDPWTRGMLQTHLKGETHLFLVAEERNEHGSTPNVAGFAIVQIIGPDAELLDIAVAPARRGQQIGSALLRDVIGRCNARGVTSLFLEVRESNLAARALYTAHHFTLAGRRKHYYQRPPEDALILKLHISVDTGIPVVSQ